jgi:hypothetical protein
VRGGGHGCSQRVLAAGLESFRDDVERVHVGLQRRMDDIVNQLQQSERSRSMLMRELERMQKVNAALQDELAEKTELVSLRTSCAMRS